MWVKNCAISNAVRLYDTKLISTHTKDPRGTKAAGELPSTPSQGQGTLILFIKLIKTDHFFTDCSLK